MIQTNKSDAASGLLVAEGHMPEAASNNTELPVMFTPRLSQVELTRKLETKRVGETFPAGGYATFDKISMQHLFKPALPLFHKAEVKLFSSTSSYKHLPS
jgi:hypothetical protein